MWEKIKALWAKLGDSKIIIVIIGILALIVKFRSILISLLVSDSKKVLDETVAKDKILAEEGAKANQQANALVEKVKNEGKDSTSVDENWNLKK